MPEGSHDLKIQIDSDERELARLSNLESELVEHVPSQGFRAATRREEIMSARRVIEERLHRNRQILNSTDDRI